MSDVAATSRIRFAFMTSHYSFGNPRKELLDDEGVHAQRRTHQALCELFCDLPQEREDDLRRLVAVFFGHIDRIASYMGWSTLQGHQAN